jgi:hypothetical protein
LKLGSLSDQVAAAYVAFRREYREFAAEGKIEGLHAAAVDLRDSLSPDDYHHTWLKELIYRYDMRPVTRSFR